MVAAITGTCPVGIDVEAIRPFRQVALAMAFSPQEQARIQDSPQPELSFFARWCLKESELKRKGGVLTSRSAKLSRSLGEMLLHHRAVSEQYDHLKYTSSVASGIRQRLTKENRFIVFDQ